MYYRSFLKLSLAAAIVLSLTISARASGIQGQVRGPDGAPLKGADVRIERTDKNTPLVTATTDRSGGYVAKDLATGVYRVSVTAGRVKSTVQIRTAGEEARVDFDLKPTATKKIKHYVWMAPTTGSRVGGAWVEADSSGAPIARMLNADTLNGQVLQELMRRATPNIITP
jgi:Carboxypeptidase regulatory-like domain